MAKLYTNIWVWELSVWQIIDLFIAKEAIEVDQLEEKNDGGY